MVRVWVYRSLVAHVFISFYSSTWIGISVKATDNFGRILTGTLSLTIFLYVLVNVGMVIGFLPVVGLLFRL